LITDGDSRGCRAEAFMPNVQPVFTRRQIFERKLTIYTGNGIKRVRRDDNPRLHPRMEVAGYFDDLGLGERDRDRAILRLCTIE